MVDPHTPGIFDGEEFNRAARFFTYGYDIYTPNRVCKSYAIVLFINCDQHSSFPIILLSLQMSYMIIRARNITQRHRLGGTGSLGTMTYKMHTID